MKAAWDAGVNFFDCAEGYAGGKSEEVMGQAIKKFGSVNYHSPLEFLYLTEYLDGRGTTLWSLPKSIGAKPLAITLLITGVCRESISLREPMRPSRGYS